MHRLMIADDEYLSRFVIKSMIEKKFPDIEIVAEPENGRQAIEYGLKLKPDIIIMDIKMPGFNGIEASRILLSELPHTQILILTAYDKFNYVKEALEIGIKGFLLKPINETEVVQTIQRIKNQISQYELQTDHDEHVEEKIKTVRPLIENELVSAFITGDFDAERIESYRELIKENDISSGFFIIITPSYNYIRQVSREISYRKIRENIYEAASSHPGLMHKCLIGSRAGSNIAVFHTMQNKKPDMELAKEAQLIGIGLANRIKSMAKIETAIGIGNVHSGFNNLWKSYNEANIALKRALKTGGVVHYNFIKTDYNTPASTEYPMDLETLLVEQLKLGKTEAAKETACEFMSQVINNSTSIEAVKESLNELITVLKRTIAMSGIRLRRDCNLSMLTELGTIRDLDEIAFWSKRCIFNLIDHIENKNNSASKLIGRVIDYINKNFNSEITLNQVADEVGLSPQYLSKIFKENYGINFIDYITKKRIKYAEELLLNSGKSIKEISCLVGYEDPNYFSRIFKKDTGCTPSQFRLQKAMGDN